MRICSLECLPRRINSPNWTRQKVRMRTLEAAEVGIYRVEQQSVTLVVQGDDGPQL